MSMRQVFDGMQAAVKKFRLLFLAATAFPFFIGFSVYFGQPVIFALPAYYVALVAALTGDIFVLQRKRPGSPELTEDEILNYRRFFEMLPAAVYTTDAAGRLTFYNDAAAELWGRRPVIGQDEWCGSWRIYTPEGARVPLDQCPMAVAIKENRAVRGIEAVVERPDGVKIPFLPYPTPIRDASGKLTGALNLLVNISERKTTETVLARRDKWFRLFSDASAIFMGVADRENILKDLFERVFKMIDPDALLVCRAGEEAPHLFSGAAAADEVAAEAILARFPGNRVTIINEIQKNGSPEAENLRELGLQACIYLPLTLDGKPIGAFLLGSFGKTYFDHDEIEFVKTIGHYVAVTIMRLQERPSAMPAAERKAQLAV
jgi:PAS domain S-box-containing protein